MRVVNSILLRLFGTLTYVRTQEKVIALTFDDGPHPEFTPRLLDILNEFNAKATFFVVGEQAEKHPDVIQRMAQEGHVVGVHSWDHPSFPLISSRGCREQIRRSEKVLGRINSKLLRPPYGHQSLRSYLDARLKGYKVIGWRVLAEDWLDHDASWLSNKLLTRVRPGDIVLLHDNLYKLESASYLDRTPTLEAVKTLLTEWRDIYQFVTVPQLLTRGRLGRRLFFPAPDVDYLDNLERSEDGLVSDRSR